MRRVLFTRNKTRTFLEKQAKKVKMTSEESSPPIPVGSSVAISVPEVNQDKAYARNIIVMENYGGCIL